MKRLQLFLILITITKLINAQSISPSIDNEFCPNTEITFTVTIPGTYTSIDIIGISGCYITITPYNFFTSGGITTFNFKGKFGDFNKAQSFQIDPSGLGYTPTFKKIKSLFYSTPCSQVPNQSSIVFPICNITNQTISFNNVNWGTSLEPTQMCFGSITTYEYQLPSGWSIGSSISNGSNWISGGNTVKVTSDLATGNGNVIRVRPTNACGKGLVNSQPPAIVPISRPNPIFTIEGLSQFCTSTTYQIADLPSGATVQYYVST